MRFEYNGNLVPRAREMRRHMTPQEQHLWYGFFSKYPVRFQRQKVIYHYIADFYCEKARLVIEVDGKQHSQPDAQEYDQIRTETLEQLDLLILRFANEEISRDFAFVCKKINSAVQERLSPSSEPPSRGGMPKGQGGV